ncbi:hypothetical protein KY290_018168 [Solanum tuberosum]|uniref:DUF4408 domain-containing protein n=1 Tax=Solanum tuberosum TaxID=4113 RepID=A0ABQ7VDE0_SOLTU|nr:hypothetical protein KY284_017112 [Solanum tuberosum]KAH0702857.1 hypothetical protein KY285_017135 [Solanum tuberosum]KAH0762095.1 hypothetical protein KY290_018168 [Solanum tuberosum]
MDSLQMKKIQAINKYRKQRLLNKIMLYSFTSMTCILILSSPLWYPLLRAFVKSLLFDSIPKLGALFFSSKCIFLIGNIIVIVLVGESKIFKSRSKVLKQSYEAEQENDDKNFIFVTGECKISRSKYSSSLPFSVNFKHGPEQEDEFCGYDDNNDEQEEEKESVNLENVMDGIKGNYCSSNYRENEELENFKELKFETEPNELSKRADDFIARVNNQIRLESVTMI